MISFVVMLALLRKRVIFMIVEFVVFPMIYLVRPPAKCVGFIVIDNNFWFFSQTW